MIRQLSADLLTEALALFDTPPPAAMAMSCPASPNRVIRAPRSGLRRGLKMGQLSGHVLFELLGVSYGSLRSMGKPRATAGSMWSMTEPQPSRVWLGLS